MLKIRVITSAKLSPSCHEVTWIMNDDQVYTSHIYRHSDGSLGCDPVFARKSVLLRQLVWLLATEGKGRREIILN